VFYGDEASVFFFIGLALLIVSILLINDSKKSKTEDASDDTNEGERVAISASREENTPSARGTGGQVKFTLRWLIFVLLSFFGNGICTTIQNAYAKTASGGTSEFMIIALLTVFLVLVCAVSISERGTVKLSLKGGWYFMVICGLANGAVNLFVILLSPLMDSSVMFPLISAGGIVLTSLVSIFFYREKLSVRQYIGMVLGIASIVFLNL
jgi:multidrug transporter EmrE-like cation transporter